MHAILPKTYINFEFSLKLDRLILDINFIKLTFTPISLSILMQYTVHLILIHKFNIILFKREIFHFTAEHVNFMFVFLWLSVFTQYFRINELILFIQIQLKRYVSQMNLWKFSYLSYIGIMLNKNNILAIWKKKKIKICRSRFNLDQARTGPSVRGPVHPQPGKIPHP